MSTYINPNAIDNNTIFKKHLNINDMMVSTTSPGMMSAVDKQNLDNSTVKTIIWNNTDLSNKLSNMNDLVYVGVYDIKGERTRSDDNLPILNTGGGNTFNARLTVLDSSISASVNDDDKCITQIITFNNRLGQGEVYIRTGKGKRLNNLTWDNWSTLQRNVNVVQVDSLDGLVDNGIYSGVLTTTGETFVLVVINNYAIAGAGKSISQFKYSVDIGGNVSFGKRVKVGNSSFPTKWEIINASEINEMMNECVESIGEIESTIDGIKTDIGKIDGIESTINGITKNIDEINNNVVVKSELNTAIEKVTPLISITYLELVGLRDSSSMIPGRKYRINDYKTTTTEQNSKSVNNKFDIIVEAFSTNKLNEDAKVCLHSNDDNDYFKNSKLDAWEIKYCLDNDTSRFVWADKTTNGKGVIYYMKDEFGNEAPYDFKNIQFKRKNENNDVYYYTFDYTINGEKYDGSVKYGKYCYNNKIEVYKYANDGKYYLPKNIMKNTSATSKCYCNIFKLNAIQNTLGNGCYNNIFGVGSWNNTFGDGCHDNTFANDCYTNVFGNSCYNNTFANDCHTNVFGNSCFNNTFDSDCKNNIFGESCQMNTFDQLCESNKFSKSCTKNTFGLYCKNNIFGESVSLVKFGEQCSENVLGNNNMLITFGLYCKKNIISSTKPDDNIVGSNGNITNRNEYNPTETKYSENAKGYIRYFTFGDSVQENIFWSNASTGVQENGSVKYLQMYNVDSYIIGKAIELTGSEMQNYMTNINRDSGGNIQQYVEGDFVSIIDEIESKIDDNICKEIVGTSGLVTIDPNKYYKFDNVSNLNVDFGNEKEGVMNNYMFQIKVVSSSDGSEINISLDKDIIWANGKEPVFIAGITYQISIINNLGVFTEFY